MITFQKIKWKNFLSTGDHFSEIDFTKNGTNLIVGTNGTGKSTVLDALTFSLFNKPFRKINKSQLINATNEKDCLVEVVLNRYGEKVLFMFEEEDDAERYAMMLNNDEKNSELNVIEIDDALAITTCKRYNYKYAVITPNDIVIPPKNDNVSKN